MYPYRKDLKTNAQTLRKTMTAEERQLWYHCLKRFPCVVKRQVCLGEYVVDFYIPKKKTAIEIDGLQHESEEGLMKDETRDNELKNLGITVLRYANKAVKENFNAVCEDILCRLQISAADLKEE